ncbi:hypothetical protein MUK42_36280 [Musa troglodytarum]|uniref:Uncharacterized protein n=1 Tax=Musa troglodytarum TaxID=320322 RepID=A0A9E7G6I0_9LILI|nr:hypothetical protein MUK42_36280 [Musa troglodytarum]
MGKAGHGRGEHSKVELGRRRLTGVGGSGGASDAFCESSRGRGGARAIGGPEPSRRPRFGVQRARARSTKEKRRRVIKCGSTRAREAMASSASYPIWCHLGKRMCEVGYSGAAMSHFTDLLGDPLCRVRHSPSFLLLVPGRRRGSLGLSAGASRPWPAAPLALLLPSPTTHHIAPIFAKMDLRGCPRALVLLRVRLLRVLVRVRLRLRLRVRLRLRLRVRLRLRLRVRLRLRLRSGRHHLLRYSTTEPAMLLELAENESRACRRLIRICGAHRERSELAKEDSSKPAKVIVKSGSLSKGLSEVHRKFVERSELGEENRTIAAKEMNDWFDPKTYVHFRSLLR